MLFLDLGELRFAAVAAPLLPHMRQVDDQLWRSSDACAEAVALTPLRP